jgi:single-strand DNA-binding protein
MEIAGTVHHIGDVESIGNNGFTKRLLVVKTNEQYHQFIPIDFVKEKISLIEFTKINQSVKVQVNLRGNENNGRYYLNLQGWKIE